MSVRLTQGSYFGEAVAQRVLSPWLTVTESRYEPGAQVPPHFHENPYFCLVVRGRFEETSDRTVRQCTPAEVIFHPPGEVHSDRFDEAGGRCLSVELSSERLGSVAKTLDRSVCFRGGRISQLAARIRSEFDSPDDFTALAIEGLGLEMCAELGRQSALRPAARPPVWLRRVRDRLHESYDLRPSLSALAQDAGVHEAHLAREFLRFYGSPIGEYVRRLRIESACLALAKTDQAIGEIALTAGFADQAHFSRTFRRLTGTTPRDYRDEWRRGDK